MSAAVHSFAALQPPNDKDGLSFCERYSQYHIAKYQAKIFKDIKKYEKVKGDWSENLPLPPPPSAPEAPFAQFVPAEESQALQEGQERENIHVCIVGAGAAGLYAAMILENVKQDAKVAAAVNLTYEILEAQEEHVGGRLLTHHFQNGGPNDYYDVGAMRFPDTPVMRRTFDLFVNRLKFTTTKDIIPYIMGTKEDIQYFNGVGVRKCELNPSIDQFKVAGSVPKIFYERLPEYWVNAKLGCLKEMLKKHGFEALKNYDKYSVRQFMRTLHPELSDEMAAFMNEEYKDERDEHGNPYGFPGEKEYPEAVIDWLETFSVGTTMYDSGLVEAVVEELDFSYGPDVNWICIQGGANRIAQAMAELLPSGKLEQNKRVAKIAPVFVGDNKEASSMLVDVAGEAEPRKYDHVISTVPLGALRMIDLEECKMSWALRQSLRSLQYGASVKVGIRFSKRWWEGENQRHYGGVSKTDRLSRMIVYPSYGMRSKDATMLVSYSWSMDALRLGALVQGHDSAAEKRLLEYVLGDLAKVHNIPYEELKSLYVDHHAYNWYSNEFTIGAFAFFGPGQFFDMYKEITQSAAGWHLHFAGEGASTNHAWVVGALDSSVRAIYQMFCTSRNVNVLREALKSNWELPKELTDEHAVCQLLGNQDGGKSWDAILKERMRHN